MIQRSSTLLVLESPRMCPQGFSREKAGLRRDAVRSQVIDVLEAQEIKETGNEERLAT